jgi:hypothetical protein
MGDSGSTTTVVNQASPSLLPEAREGYVKSQDFCKSLLTAPPTYTGPRVAPLTSGQISGINQTYDYFGAPQPYQLNAENQVAGTAAGNYMYGPEAQQAVASLSDPIFRRFEQETLPAIRDRSQLSGQGLLGSRRVVADTNAISDLGHQLALSAYAPVFNQERDRMLKAAGMTPEMLMSETLRLGQLNQAGTQERSFIQQLYDAAKQQWEEPLARQQTAASSLFAAPGFGQGPTSSKSETTQQTSVADSVMGLATTALLAYAVLGKK